MSTATTSIGCNANAPHMLGHIHMDRLNADLLAFLEGKEVAEPREAARAKQVK